jgi:hypothetical protein
MARPGGNITGVSMLISFKVGRTNNMGVITKDTDWQSYTLRMVELLNRLGKPHYVKRDLQKYLPPGYPNSMRVPQHH